MHTVIRSSEPASASDAVSDAALEHASDPASQLIVGRVSDPAAEADGSEARPTSDIELLIDSGQIVDSRAEHDCDREVAAGVVEPAGSEVGSRTERRTGRGKLDILREKLEQRASDIARVMEMYQAKERECHRFTERLVEKDVESQSLRMTIDDLTAQNEALEEQLERRLREYSISFERLNDEKTRAENDLIRAVAAKEKELKDARDEAEAGVRRARQREEALEASLAEAARHRAARAEELGGLKDVLADRDRRLEDLEKRLGEASSQTAALERTREALELKVAEQAENLRNRDDNLRELRNELQFAHQTAEADVKILQHEIDARNELLQKLRAELSAADLANRRNTEAFQSELAELGVRLVAGERKLVAEAEARQALEVTFATRQEEWEAQEANLKDSLARAEIDLASERMSRGTLDETLRRELAALEGSLGRAERERAAARQTLDATKAAAAAEVAALEEQAKVLERRLGQEREGREKEREAREKERERARMEATMLSSRLEDASARVAALTAEKQAVEESKSAEIAERDREIQDLRAQLEDRKKDSLRYRKSKTDLQERTQGLQQELERAQAEVQDGERARQELEARYLREIEAQQEGFLARMKEKDDEHARELEALRSAKLELTRTVKASHLAAQRLSDRIQKLEAELLQRKEEDEFELFLRRRDHGGGPSPRGSLEGGATIPDHDYRAEARAGRAVKATATREPEAPSHVVARDVVAAGRVPAPRHPGALSDSMYEEETVVRTSGAAERRRPETEVAPAQEKAARPAAKRRS